MVVDFDNSSSSSSSFHHTDYGALWTGANTPFLHQTLPADKFLALCGDLPVEAFKRFFNPHLTRNTVYQEDYVRFISWFSNYDDAWGHAGCNVSRW